VLSAGRALRLQTLTDHEPHRHGRTIYQLTLPEQGALWELVGEVRARLLTGLRPDGFNFKIGFNDGLAAGQTLAHAHIHIIRGRDDDVPDPRGGIRRAG
jgi:diadenosine tetraphosphate (Ap4A) HIT family hydrolase